MDLQGTLTVELFLMPDESLVVNELAPRVHNSGHWTIEGAATSQFEQHIRAICGLGLGATAAHRPAAMVNLLGTGPRRDARLLGVAEALADPAVHLHLYDKREVFERRKMGHLTALGATPDQALGTVKAALAKLEWAAETRQTEDDRIDG
jgi:5-(carboxyamino)imidazole ribonucleotide synthase